MSAVQPAQRAEYGADGTNCNAATQQSLTKPCPVFCRMQSLGRLGTLDSQQATIEATLRLKELGEEEARTQAGIAIDPVLRLVGAHPSGAPRRAQRGLGSINLGSVFDMLVTCNKMRCWHAAGLTEAPRDLLVAWSQLASKVTQLCIPTVSLA